MKYIIWALRVIIFLAVLFFAYKNMNLVEVTFFDGVSMAQVPLVVVMLVTFVLGTLFGLLLTVPSVVRRRRELSRSRRELDRIQAIVTPQTATSGRDNVSDPIIVTPL
jgi:putative membrane protein